MGNIHITITITVYKGSCVGNGLYLDVKNGRIGKGGEEHDFCRRRMEREEEK
jgi:hypothetical protein